MVRWEAAPQGLIEGGLLDPDLPVPVSNSPGFLNIMLNAIYNESPEFADLPTLDFELAPQPVVAAVPAVSVIPCDERTARPSVVFVQDLADLVRSALHGAGQLGWGPWAREQVRGTAGRGERAGRDLLRAMMMTGVPLLMATGVKTCDADAQGQLVRAAATCASGSPLLVVDGLRNLVAVVRPMGTPTYAPVGAPGLMPDDLKNRIMPSTSCIQMFVDIVGVAPYPLLACAKSIGGWHGNARFNWGADALGDKRLDTQPGNIYLNRRLCITRLFGEAPLTALDARLGDFEAKLAAFRGVDKVDGVRDRANAQNEYVMWRRALMLKMMVEHDVTGTMAHSLAGMFPASILGADPLPPPAPKPAVFVFSPSVLGTFFGALSIDDIHELTAALL